MPDTNINAGTPARWENAGVISIGTAGSAKRILWVEPGTLKVQCGRTEGIPQMDRSLLTSTVVEGDERESVITFETRISKAGLTTAADLLASLFPAPASGLKTLFTLNIEIPDSKVASTGVRATFNNCYVAERDEYQAGGSGKSVDKISLTIHSQDADPSWTAY